MDIEKLENYMQTISELCSVREHSEGRVTIAAYIGSKHIMLEGSYDLVLLCVNSLYREHNAANP